jgi:single-strand DNA-binding protein
MASINKVILIGRLGRDPELHVSALTDAAAAVFSLATSETWKDKATGEKQERTEWHRVVAWGWVANICAKYLKKGSLVYVEGKLRTNTYERDGVKHSKTEVIAEEVEFLGGRGDSQPADDTPKLVATKQSIESLGEHLKALCNPADATPKGDDDDIPF